MLLYYPLSAFITLFANCLQNPLDFQATSDLELMEYVTSYLSPAIIQVSPLAATTSIVFQELRSLATQIVEEAISHNTTDNRTCA